MSDLKKLGMDRGTTSTATSVKPVTNRPTVGQISAGYLLNVKFGNSTLSSATAEVKLKGRPTAALPAANSSVAVLDHWYIQQGVLYVTVSAAIDDTLQFWVF